MYHIHQFWKTLSRAHFCLPIAARKSREHRSTRETICSEPSQVEDLEYLKIDESDGTPELCESQPLPQDAPILRLPFDLIYLFFEQLPAESQICFTLTCKELHQTFPRRIPNKEERIQLLYLLEKNIPEMILCTHCEKLYRWIDVKHRPRCPDFPYC